MMKNLKERLIEIRNNKEYIKTNMSTCSFVKNFIINELKKRLESIRTNSVKIPYSLKATKNCSIVSAVTKITTNPNVDSNLRVHQDFHSPELMSIFDNMMKECGLNVEINTGEEVFYVQWEYDPNKIYAGESIVDILNLHLIDIETLANDTKNAMMVYEYIESHAIKEAVNLEDGKNELSFMITEWNIVNIIKQMTSRAKNIFFNLCKENGIDVNFIEDPKFYNRITIVVNWEEETEE